MATQPSNRGCSADRGPAYDNADYGEALVLAHSNATHLPSAHFPIYDPDMFYSMHTLSERIFCSAMARCISSPAASTPTLIKPSAPLPAAKRW